MTRSFFPEEVVDAREVIALRQVAGLGDVGVARLLSLHGDAARALASVAAARRDDALGTADRILADLRRIGGEALVAGTERYPSRLLELADSPPVIYAQGTLVSANPPAVAIVGTRAASAYGLRVARAIATACARAGVTIVSGLARGIDGAAHEAALAAGGRTVAVLGTGLDVHYPRSHRTLQERIARDGLLLTEQRPGDTGHGGTFPRRNRIIAALADLTVVVEAGTGSGALITADHALELNRTVACVPNAIDQVSSLGSNALLKMHAEPILAVDDVLALLRVDRSISTHMALDGDAARCWDAVQRGARDIEQVAAHAQLRPREAAAVLSALEIDGLVHFGPSGQVHPSIGVS
ncbi:DNA-processing protein DprA [Gemmatimonas sp.]|uniref:DNA-processing protein DprA n=1 Tax=Gemmatimonas sp. TaxID=1962908 RepID=UPI00286E66D5|nr:DNA-processing protein DprA [Gemmatimonas sp.]